MTLRPLLVPLCLWLGCHQAQAASFYKADVTSLLGPSFFMDDAAPGGTDATSNQPSSGVYTRSFAGLLTANQGSTTVNLTGFGFATNSATVSNDATSVVLSFTYLGADGVLGGTDDVVVGSTTVGFLYTGAGEYSCVFDAPLTATLNITATNFRIVVTPSNAGGDGSINFKIGTLAYEASSGARLSVAGTTSTMLPATARRVNLAKFQPTSASTNNGQYHVDFLTDGVVGNSNSWRSGNFTTTHLGQVTLPFPATVASAHLYLGIDDTSFAASFKLQYDNAGAWVDVPGSARTGNTANEVNILFTSAVTSHRFRAYTDVDGPFRVKELALFGPNPAPGTGVEQGYPLGTDVEVNLARERPVVVSAISGSNYAKHAVDGLVSSSSKWQTTTVGTNTLDIDLRVATKLGSAHLYSGDGSVAPIADFTLQSWSGTAWVDIPGAVITGNTSAARVITFTTPPTTSQLRLTFNNASTSAVRELCVFAANGGASYPLGQEALAATATTRKFDDYHDAYYAVTSRAANLPLAVNGSSPVLDPGNLDAKLSQYQLLLNVGTDTYRLCNRSTGRCLAGAALSSAAGAALVDEDFTLMPHQSWRLISVDGTDYYLLNAWSGLVAGTASSTAGAALVQQAMSGSTMQHWRFTQAAYHPKKGMAGFIDRQAENKGQWGYNWGRTNAATLPDEVLFHPMQWGSFNWDIGSNQGPIEQFNSPWRREDRGLHLLGFNEPDGSSQANLTVAQVVSLWPRLERMDLPLVSPVAVNPDNTWMDDFMTQAQAQGLRVDAIAAHNYPSPNSGSADDLITLLQSFNTTWSKPVWLTEFSTVDWAAGTAAQTSGSTAMLNGVWGSSATSVWAVGANGTILKYNGTTWAAQTSGTTETLTSVWGSSATSVWAVGANGTILKFNGTTWAAQTSGTTELLNSVWGSSATSVWAVGANGTVLKHNGTTWSAQSSGSTAALNAVWGSSGTSVWAVGDTGTILKHDGSTWTAQTSGITSALNGVWGSSGTSVWTVGAAGTILKHNGSTWTAQTSGITQDLNAVRGTDANNVWAAGAAGTRIKTLNGGTSWTLGSSSTSQVLNAIWSSDVNNSWFVGANGVILKSSPGSATWTEEDNYNWLAEFIWRAESLPWLRRHSLFLFTANADSPEPTNPWDAVGPRSNAFQSDGTTPTPFGELYFAWDGDATVRTDKAYFIHNKSQRKRLRNAISSTAPAARSIRDPGDTVQWVLRPSDTASQYYVTSLRDGRRLRYASAVLDFAPANTTGAPVRWTLTEDTHGWYYLENPAAAAANRRLRYDGTSFAMVANTTTADTAKWRFIVPQAPIANSIPTTLAGLTATAGDAQVSLTWTPSTDPDHAHYSVYRSTTPGGPYTLVASNITGTSYTNTALQNGTTYYYTVTATDLIGNESQQSTVSTAKPTISTLPLPGAFTITRTANTATLTWPSTHLGWILETQTNTLTGTWLPVPNTSTTTTHATTITGVPTFFRLRRP